MAQVLKPKHSLIGKSLIPVIAKVKAMEPSRITERLLSGRKESNQTNKQSYGSGGGCFVSQA